MVACTAIPSYTARWIPPVSTPPYVVGIVQLDEGPRLLTNIVDCSIDQLHIDLRVGLRLVALDEELNLYPFAPVASERA